VRLMSCGLALAFGALPFLTFELPGRACGPFVRLVTYNWENDACALQAP
jgi:hypothetical protein